jgi:methylmalonyl-CoA mutase C-terminal domain/subunit
MIGYYSYHLKIIKVLKINYLYPIMAAQDHQQQDRRQRPIRVLVSKLGLDGHDRGALVICRALRDAGMEVIYSGLFCSPEQVSKAAIDEDVDAVAMSLLNGAHLTLFPKVARLLKERGMEDILIVGGGVIPEGDKQILEKQGITGNFGPGTALSIIIDHIRTNVKNLRLNNEENGK